MKVKLYDLNFLFKLKENNNFIKQIKYGSNDIILNALYFIYAICFVIFSVTIWCLIESILKGFTEQNVFAIKTFLFFSIGLSITSTLLVYFAARKEIKNLYKQSINYLNEAYVDPNNQNKIYLLHELIEKYDFTINNKIDFKMNISLNTNMKYKHFKYIEYSNPQVEKILFENIIPKKKLSEHEALLFYIKNIEPQLKSKNISFEEKEKLLKQLSNLNNVKI